MKNNIKCPYCGATVEIEKAKGLKCPFCSGSLLNKFADDNKIYFVAPFKKGKSEIENQARKRLVEKSGILIDVINSLSFEIEKAFVPLFSFGVSYKITYSQKKSYRLLTSATSKFHIFLEKYEYFSSEYIEDLDDEDLDDEDLDDEDLDDEEQRKEIIDIDAKVYAMDIKEKDALKSKEVEEYFKGVWWDAYHSVPKYSSYDFVSQEGNDDKLGGVSYLVAVWILRYKYEGELFEIIINGNNGEVLKETYPQISQNNANLSHRVKADDNKGCVVTMLIALSTISSFLVCLAFLFGLFN